jgi:hypothetical protein
MKTAVLEVTVVIAVREDGYVTCSVIEECRLIQKRAHEDWLRRIREDTTHLWVMKTVKTHVPMPIQYEDQTDA